MIAAARERAGPRLLVVVTADHGRAWATTARRRTASSSMEPPCASRSSWPGPACLAASARPGVARSGGILPTILARAGVAVPAGLPGADLLQGPRPRESYAETLYPQTLGWAPLPRCAAAR